MDYIITDNELYHYGVLGMKWGHRKGSQSIASKKFAAGKQSAANDRASGQKITARQAGINAKRARMKAGREITRRAKGEVFAKRYVSHLNKTLADAGHDLDLPYRQPIGGGVYANWPSKRKYIESEISRVTRDQQNGKPFYMLDDAGRKMVVK